MPPNDSGQTHEKVWRKEAAVATMNTLLYTILVNWQGQSGIVARTSEAQRCEAVLDRRPAKGPKCQDANPSVTRCNWELRRIPLP